MLVLYYMKSTLSPLYLNMVHLSKNNNCKPVFWCLIYLYFFFFLEILGFFLAKMPLTNFQGVFFFLCLTAQGSQLPLSWHN